MEEVTLGIYVQSYKRSDKILTANLLEDCTYVVRKSEEEDYRKAGIKKIWAIDDELINNAIKTYWYIQNESGSKLLLTRTHLFLQVHNRTGADKD